METCPKCSAEINNNSKYFLCAGCLVNQICVLHKTIDKLKNDNKNMKDFNTDLIKLWNDSLSGDVDGLQIVVDNLKNSLLTVTNRW